MYVYIYSINTVNSMYMYIYICDSSYVYNFTYIFPLFNLEAARLEVSQIDRFGDVAGEGVSL